MTRWNSLQSALEGLQGRAIPATRTTNVVQARLATLVKRDSTSTCTAGSKSASCQVDGVVADTNTIIIVLSVVIPSVFAILAFYLLHRRHAKRQRAEEANDKNDALDYGLDGLPGYKKGKKGRKGGLVAHAPVAEMDEKEVRSCGVSMELNNPFVLSEVMRDSTDSFHSLSRSTHDIEDPYRPSHLMRADQLSLRPYATSSISKFDTSSMFSGSSESVVGRRGLLHHSQLPSRSSPRSESLSESPASSSPASLSPNLAQEIQQPEPAFMRKPLAQIPTPNIVVPASPFIPATPNGRLVREGSDQQGAFVPAPKALTTPTIPVVEISSPASVYTPPAAPPLSGFPTEVRQSHSPPPVPKRASKRVPNLALASIDAQIQSSAAQEYDDSLTYADVLGIVQSPSTASPTLFATSPNPQGAGVLHGLGVQGLQFDTRDPSSRLRPLPPNDPNENAEQRANRIRSFYREYFDSSKNGGARQQPAAQYYEDYDQEYLNEAPIYDPLTGQFIIAGAPFAQPVSRRAMTPPPRAPPRFQHGSPRQHGSMSAGGPRAYSSASNANAAEFRGRAPRRPIVPPSPLMNLPTPHMLKDTTGAWSPIDFAPPQSYRDRQAGVATSPRSDSRPYSPGAKAHTPLASSYDDLAVIPSPHALRKSSTFTALDFAAPPRFRNGEAGGGVRSDTGSVHSMRSGISTVHQASIRAGAYRVSRIPKEFVGTRDDFAIALKPSWDQRA